MHELILYTLLKEYKTLKDSEIRIAYKTLFSGFLIQYYVLEKERRYPIFRMGQIKDNEFIDNTDLIRFAYNPKPLNRARCTIPFHHNDYQGGPIYTVLPSETSQFITGAKEIRISAENENNCFLSSWGYKRDLRLLIIGGVAKNGFQALRKIKMNKDFHNRKFLKSDFQLSREFFLEYIFSKEVPDDDQDFYKLSAIFFYYLKNSFDGIIYNSVQTNGTGLVMVLFPELYYRKLYN